MFLNLRNPFEGYKSNISSQLKLKLELGLSVARSWDKTLDHSKCVIKNKTKSLVKSAAKVMKVNEGIKN